MKTYLTAFLLWIFHFNCTAQWIELNSGFNNYFFSEVFAVTPDNVIVIGNNGLIIRSTNGGNSWLQKNSATSENLNNVQFPSQQVGFITGNLGMVLKTTDSGETWTPINIENISAIYALSCVNENLIFISTDKGLIKSEDGGANWSNPIQAPPYNDIQFINNEIGFTGQNYWTISDHKFSKTKDGGLSWEQLNALSPFHFLNENIGFYYYHGLYKTINGGNQFNLIPETEVYPSYLRGIAVINENTVWGILERPTLDYDTSTKGIVKISKSGTGEYTTNIRYDGSPDIDMNSIHFATENCGYIVGKKYGQSKIWKNGNGINILASKENEKMEDIKIFPNPTSEKINITVDHQFSNEATITLSDLSGKLVHNQNYRSKKVITIDVRSFAKGTYVLTIKNQKQNYSQKIIIN